jgi:hypothetical protein
VRNNGETNPVTYLVVVALAAAGFYVFHVAPVYMGNLEVKEATAEALNVYALNGEEAARAGLLSRLNIKNQDTTHYEVDDEGVESIKPGFGITDEQVTMNLDESTKKLIIRVEYDRIVEFKPLKKRKTFHLVAEKIGSIK